MDQQNGVALSCGLLAGFSIWLTGLLSLPAWLMFLAWLTFFCGLGRRGLTLQFASNLFGIAIGTAALSILEAVNGPLVVTVVVVAISAFLIAQAGRLDLLAQVPGSFVGFVMIAAASQTTGLSVSTWSVDGPVYLAVLAVVLGSAFGVVSERLARALSAPVTPSTEQSGQATA